MDIKWLFSMVDTGEKSDDNLRISTMSQIFEKVSLPTQK